MLYTEETKQKQNSTYNSMELSKKSELAVGSVSYVIRTELTRDASPSIQTRVLGVDGAVVFQTSQDVSSLRPLAGRK